MLLDDIINLSVEGHSSIATLLGKCLLLAHELNNSALEQWATNELNGYPPDGDLPDYRILAAPAKGNFRGPMHSELRDEGIPSIFLEEKHRKFAEEISLADPISSYEELVNNAAKNGGKGNMILAWPPNLVLYYQAKLSNRGFMLASAWQELPPSALTAIIDQVKTRVLKLALDVKRQLGTTNDDALTRLTPVQADRVQQQVINNIYGGTNFFSSGQSTINVRIAEGDFEHLRRALQNSGVSQDEISSLRGALERDGTTFGSKVKDWVRQTAPKVITAGVKIGSEVGAKVLTAYLNQYLGVPSS